jgi:hypothetical protein
MTDVFDYVWELVKRGEDEALPEEARCVECDEPVPGTEYEGPGTGDYTCEVCRGRNAGYEDPQSSGRDFGGPTPPIQATVHIMDGAGDAISVIAEIPGWGTYEGTLSEIMEAHDQPMGNGPIE